MLNDHIISRQEKLQTFPHMSVMVKTHFIESIKEIISTEKHSTVTIKTSTFDEFWPESMFISRRY